MGEFFDFIDEGPLEGFLYKRNRGEQIGDSIGTRMGRIVQYTRGHKDGRVAVSVGVAEHRGHLEEAIS